MTRLALILVLVCSSHLLASTFVVTNVNDDGPRSLRQAITDANAHPNGQAPDEIAFNIPGAGVQTIILESALPEITDPVIINGWSQPGWNGAPLIELTAQPGSTTDGLTISAGATTVRGLVVNGFNGGIDLQQSDHNVVQGCYIGTDNSGLVAAPNSYGIAGTGSNNLVGGVEANARNIISGNRGTGVTLGYNAPRFGESSVGNTIQGNYIGTDVKGTYALPNSLGISLQGDGSRLGGSDPGAGNVISGNSGGAITQYGFGVSISNNMIGVDRTGSYTIRNNSIGIDMQSYGGEIRNNVISGNGGGGVMIRSASALVQGNSIGTDVTGTIALGNGGTGITFSGPDNIIGGATPRAGNVISSNAGAGIKMITVNSFFNGYPNPQPAVHAIIQGNLIGTDITGTVALPNAGDGIDPREGLGNKVGGTSRAARNVISGNSGNGIVFGASISDQYSAVFHDVVAGNLIGTQSDGKTPLGNDGHGVVTPSADATTIGSDSGPNTDAGNVIAFNGGNGVAVLLSTSPTPSPSYSYARISANSIHDNAALGIDLKNDGVTAPPVQISAAYGYDEKLTVYGSVTGVPNARLTLEFFANKAADTSGYGEGGIFLGQAAVTADSNGKAAFNATFPLPANASFVSATVIDGGNTSEFAADVAIAATAPLPPPTGPTPVILPTHSDQLLNISTRLRVEPGDHALIDGFIVTGTDPKKVIVRGIGPSLSTSGVPGVLADPILELYDGSGKLIASNDDWRSGQQAEVQASGIAPKNDAESAIVQTLLPGNYTAILRGKNNTSGVGLVDAYDLTAGAASHFGNISTRGFVGTGDNAMIAGFIVGSAGGAGANIVVRAVGPSLTASGISDPLLDPTLELRDANGVLVKSNDDWLSNSSNDLRASGLAPTNYSESAIVATVAAGNYTAIVRGKNNTVGTALVEVYDVGH